MKTKLASKPNILGWMSPTAKKFRKDFPKFASKLPEYSFLDPKTFKILGYFVGQNVGSIVLKVSDKSGTYVFKSTHDPKTIISEVAFLNAWRKVGADTLKVLELIKPRKDFPFAVAIMEYIPKSTTEEELFKTDGKLEPVYKKFGQGLALLHRAKGKGFGSVKSVNPFEGKYSTFSKMIEAELGKKQQQILIKKKLIKKEDLLLISKAISIIEKDIKNGTKPSLIHDDPGIFNTFGTKSLKFFDPNPKISHPFEDLAHALIWAGFSTTKSKVGFDKKLENMRHEILQGYGAYDYNDTILQAAIFLKILGKWSWWVHRGKTEKIALDWIEGSKELFNNAKNIVSKI